MGSPRCHVDSVARDACGVGCVETGVLRYVSYKLRVTGRVAAETCGPASACGRTGRGSEEVFGERIRNWAHGGATEDVAGRAICPRCAGVCSGRGLEGTKAGRGCCLVHRTGRHGGRLRLAGSGWDVHAPRACCWRGRPLWTSGGESEALRKLGRPVVATCLTLSGSRVRVSLGRPWCPRRFCRGGWCVPPRRR